MKTEILDGFWKTFPRHIQTQGKLTAPCLLLTLLVLAELTNSHTALPDVNRSKSQTVVTHTGSKSITGCSVSNVQNEGLLLTCLGPPLQHQQDPCSVSPWDWNTVLCSWHVCPCVPSDHIWLIQYIILSHFSSSVAYTLWRYLQWLNCTHHPSKYKKSTGLSFSTLEWSMSSGQRHLWFLV